MGQTQSNQVDDKRLYAEYINKQQELIRQQQHQINSLYKYNMTMTQETPANIRFEKRQDNSNNNSYKALPSAKLDPYKILEEVQKMNFRKYL